MSMTWRSIVSVEFQNY